MKNNSNIYQALFLTFYPAAESNNIKQNKEKTFCTRDIFHFMKNISKKCNQSPVKGVNLPQNKLLIYVFKFQKLIFFKLETLTFCGLWHAHFHSYLSLWFSWYPSWKLHPPYSWCNPFCSFKLLCHFYQACWN